MTLSAEMVQALAVAVRQYHASKRRYEEASQAFADAQAQLAYAERDLHEIARALEMLDAAGTMALVSELVVNDQAVGNPSSTSLTVTGNPSSTGLTVTMPVVAVPGAIGESTPAQIVLELLKQQVMGPP
jgi:hypothetical protein